MGFPSTTLESFYRNSIVDVGDFASDVTVS